MSSGLPRDKGWWLGMPAILFMAALFLLPVLHLMLSSLVVSSDDGGWSLSLHRYTGFFTDKFSLRLLARTAQISAVTVLTSFILAFPVALFLRELSPRMRGFIAVLLLSPLLTSLVVRTLAWVILLGPKGLLNEFLAWAGHGPVSLIYNNTGVIIGLTHIYFGYMLLSIMTSVLKIDERVVLAAANLGASRWQIILRVFLPLSLPGIAAGAILVFSMCASAYVTPVLLGGTSSKVLATEIYDQAVNYLEWKDAATMAVILFAMVWLAVAATFRLTESRGASPAAGAAR